MRVSLFGGVLAIDAAGEMIDIGSTKCRAVLAALALSAGKTVTVRRLVECVWGSEPPQKAEKTLQSYVSLLRSALAPHGVTIRRGGAAYVLELDRAEVDVLRFEREIDCGNAEGALGEWTGLPLAGLDAPGLEPVVAGLVERWQSAMHAHLAEQIDRGRAHDTIGRLTELTVEHPFQEDWWELLMLALYRVGRQADALAAFREARRCLIDELGVEPGPRLRKLEADILRHDSAIEPLGRPLRHGPDEAAVGAAGSGGGYRTNLPAQVTSFVGREAELDELVAVVSAHRLVTLTGVGGVGKTRLAVQLAAEVSGGFPDGVWLVELAPVGDPAAVPDAVAAVLGVTAQAGRSVSASVVEALSGRRLLLVLDNCEHVLGSAADLAEMILAGARTVTVIATSREGLRVAAEQLWAVPSLDVESGATSAAVKLFVERAGAVLSGFSLAGEAETTAVLEICRRLEGIALSIELAAARMVSMTPAEVRDRLGDRFRLLSGSPRGLERHQTLRHAVAWSYDLLDDDERDVLGHCSVFADGFDLAGAVYICGDGEGLDEYAVLDLLDSLVRKSLIVAEQLSGRTRYGMLETIRQFAEDQLTATGLADEVRNRHATYFAEQVVAYWVGWDGPEQRVALDWVDAEFANLRAAYRWASDEADLVNAAAIAAHTTMLAWQLQRFESVGWAEHILEAATEADLPRLPRLYTAASLCVFVDRPETALRHARTAIELEALSRYDPFDTLWATFMKAHAYLFVGRIDRWLEICELLAGRGGISHVAGLGALVFFKPAQEAMVLAEEALDAARGYGNPCFIAAALAACGRAFTETDPGRALGAFREGRRYADEQRLDYFWAVIARDSAELEAIDGEIDQALELFDTAIDFFHRAGDYRSLGSVLAYVAVFFDRFEQPEIASILHGASSNFDTTNWAGDRSGVVEDLRSRLAPAAYEKSIATGAAMDISQSVQYARHQIRSARLQFPLPA